MTIYIAMVQLNQKDPDKKKMGRAKLKMELISKEKSRNATFKKRKEGLLKKLYEFTTLCNVNGLMIMYGPKQANGSGSNPEIWTNSSGNNTTTKSSQQQEIQNLIDEYKKENSLQSGSTKTFGLPDYFVDRNKKVEEELIKLKKVNTEKKYPCWLEFMDQLPELKLRDFLTFLDDKVENVKSRINLLKGNFSSDYLMEGDMIDLGGGQTTRLSQLTHYNDNPMVQGGTEFGDYNYREQLQGPINYPYCNSVVNHQEMMMLMMNENDWQYNNGASSSSSVGIGSNNMRCALMKYETMMTHNMVGANTNQTYSPYVAPTILQPNPCMMMSSAMPQIQHSWRDDERDEAKFSPYMRK